MVIDVIESLLIPFCGHLPTDHLLLWVRKGQRMSKWRSNRGGVQLKGGTLFFNCSPIVAVKQRWRLNTGFTVIIVKQSFSKTAILLGVCAPLMFEILTYLHAPFFYYRPFCDPASFESSFLMHQAIPSSLHWLFPFLTWLATSLLFMIGSLVYPPTILFVLFYSLRSFTN